MLVLFAYAEIREDAETCLSRNIWFEAAYEPYQGQRAVGLVTALRTISGEYPRSICRAVYQLRQFSWTLDPRKITEPIKDPAYQAVRRLAREILELRKNRLVLLRDAQALGIPADGYFYKRLDNIRVSAKGKQFFDLCTVAVIDPKDPAGIRQLVIGAHAFYRPRPGGCLEPPMPKPFIKPLPEVK